MTYEPCPTCMARKMDAPEDHDERCELTTLRSALSAAREEARREREQADVWQSQLHDTAAALYLAKEEARRLTEDLSALRRWEENRTATWRQAETEWKDRAHASESSARRLREALEALVLRLDAVHAHPSYQGVWSIAQMHWGPYSGPTYVDALAAARAALGSSPGDTKGEAT